MHHTRIISGLVAAAALCGVSAMAQITYQNGDLLAGFANGASGGTPDVIVDLGSIANFQQPNSGPISFAGVGGALNAVYGSDLTGVYWSVFGVNDTSLGGYNHSVSQTDPYTVWNTLARNNPGIRSTAPYVDGSSSQQQLAVTDVETIGSLTDPNNAGPGNIADLSPGIISVKTSVGGYSSMMFGPYNGNFQGDWAYNVLNLGPGVSDLYQSNPGNSFTQHASYLGDFVLDSSGHLTFDPVPEPSTLAVIGGGFVCLLAARRLKNRS